MKACECMDKGLCAITGLSKDKLGLMMQYGVKLIPPDLLHAAPPGFIFTSDKVGYFSLRYLQETPIETLQVRWHNIAYLYSDVMPTAKSEVTNET